MTLDPESLDPPRRGRGRPPRDPAARAGDPGVIGGPAAESFSHAILDSLPALVAVLEPDGRIIAVNKAWERFSQEAAEERPGAPGLGGNYLDALQDRTAFESARAEEARAGLQLVLDRQRSRFELEYPVEVAGERRWFLLSVTPLLGADGGAAVSHAETTGRRRAEQEVADQHRMLEAVFDSSAAGIVVADTDGQFLHFNRAARELAGVGLIQGDPSTWNRDYGIFHPDRVTMMALEELPLWRAMRGESTDRVRLFLRNPAIPGGRFVEISGRPWTTPEGDRRGGVVVFSDVTDQVLAEERSRLQVQVLDAVPVAVLALDADARVVYWNRAAEQLTGWSAAELVGRRGRDVLLDDEQRAQVDAIRAYVLTNRPFRGEFRVTKPDGSRLAVLASATARFGADGTLEGFVVVGLDLTDVDLTREALRVREAELREFQKMEAIGRLAGGIAHDFNNLLTVMRGYTDILLGRLASGDPARGEAELVSRAIDRAQELTSQLLVFGGGEPGEATLLSLNRVVSDLMPMLRRTLGERIRVRVELDPDLGLARADATRLGQVLLNVVLNARDAMPEGGELTLRTSHAEPPPSPAGSAAPPSTGVVVRLSIADTGAGMEESVRARVFEPFFSTRDAGQGSGLGLTTAYVIVRQLGGDIRVDSEPGRGTTVTIDLPRVFETHAPPPAAAPAPGAVEPATILVVEDDAGVRGLERRQLEAAGHLVLEAEGAEAAIEIARAYSGPIDLVVCDVVMRDKDGPAVVADLRALRPGLSALFVSGHPPDVAVRGVPAEVPFLQKPFTAAALNEAVRRALSRPSEAR